MRTACIPASWQMAAICKTTHKRSLWSSCTWYRTVLVINDAIEQWYSKLKFKISSYGQTALCRKSFCWWNMKNECISYLGNHAYKLEGCRYKLDYHYRTSAWKDEASDTSHLKTQKTTKIAVWDQTNDHRDQRKNDFFKKTLAETHGDIFKWKCVPHDGQRLNKAGGSEGHKHMITKSVNGRIC